MAAPSAPRGLGDSSLDDPKRTEGAVSRAIAGALGGRAGTRPEPDPSSGQPGEPSGADAPGSPAAGPPGGDGLHQQVGGHLRREREARQVSLEELSQTTRIPLRTLDLIEDGRFDDLPGDVFVRGFLKAYARALGLSEDEVLARYDGLRASHPPPPPARTTPLGSSQGEGGFGIAIALVILLVLFTLALSIVLRPRRRDAPVELSWAVPAQVVPRPSAPPMAVSARGCRLG
ncbi:MAG TPA: helix-turn-helix domain-containing protein [Polyangiaceae bacterium LLY-WYZ-14_1]|nr:helix-turn-helix domain-containing protein [Polyangiaceae bacterium LLY-WYZ-14_1]